MAPALAEAIRSVSDPVVVMRRVTEEALRLLPQADGASLEMRRGDVLLEYLCAAGTLSPYVGLKLQLDSSLSGLTALTGQLQRCDDAYVDERVDAEACRRTGVRSMLCVPLLGGSGRPVGVLKVSSREAAAFTPQDEGVLDELADFLGVAVGAAADLARAAAGVLTRHPRTGDGDSVADREAIRFVANVLNPGLLHDVETTDRVRGVLERRAVRTVVQPIVELDSGVPVWAEALTRFPDPPSQGPDVWFAEAHAVGLGVELELLALATALDVRPLLPAGVVLTVNLGPETLLREGVLDVLTGIPAGGLVLELTEHAKVGDYAALGCPLRQLRSAGVQLAIDDTGSGYNSLQHLLALHPDVIKLDRELVRGIAHDPARRAMASALVTFAAELGSHVVAEGIEEEAEARVLLDLGVRYGQGYFLHRPAEPAEVDWSRRWNCETVASS